MTNSKDLISVIATHTRSILDQLGFGEEIQINVAFESSADLYQVFLQTTQPALLIGFHGETLAAIQTFLGQHIHATTDTWLNISLNVNDYRERRESSLHALADSAVQQVLATGIPHSLPPLPANERRIVHVYLADHSQVSTSSQGVGRSRSVIISPK